MTALAPSVVISGHPLVEVILLVQHNALPGVYFQHFQRSP